MSEETKASWPAWYYGPNDQAEIFEKAGDVPAGWVDHPALVGKAAPAKTTAPAPAKKAGRPAKTTKPAAEPKAPDKALDL